MEVIEKGTLKEDIVCEHIAQSSDNEQIVGDLLVETCPLCNAFRVVAIWNESHTMLQRLVNTWIRN